MAIYYKGDVINVDDINIIEKEVSIGYYIEIDDCNSRKITSKDKTYLKKQWDNLFSNIDIYKLIPIEEKKVQGILDKYFDDYLNEISVRYSIDQYEIIGEKIVDENEEIYIKEYYSGLIFPVASFNAQTRDYNVIRKSYYNYIQLKIGYDFENLAKTQAVVTNLEVADINEVNKYIHQFDIKKNLFNRKGIDKERKKCFISKVTELYNENVFSKEIVPIKEEKKELASQSKETKIMENIEYLLSKLKSSNYDKYQEFNKKYEDLLSENNEILKLRDLSFTTLSQLENEIELYLIYEKNGANSILGYLEDRKNEYLNNLNSSDKTRITIEDLDKIAGLFLNTKDSYSVIEQRKVIRNISLLYLFEMIENVDELDIEKLKNSYANAFVKSIYIEIKILIEEGLIKSDYLFDLESDINLENIIDIINSIKINQKTMKK